MDPPSEDKQTRNPVPRLSLLLRQTPRRGIVFEMNQIHGHEVLKMMIESGKTYTKATLAAEIITKFGADARFNTCSAEDLTAEQLVAFLDSKGKFIPQEDGIQTSADLMCKH